MRQGCSQYKQDYASVHLHFVSKESLSQDKIRKTFYLLKGRILTEDFIQRKQSEEKVSSFFFEVGKPKKNVESVASLMIRNRLANNNTSYSGLLPYW